MVHRKLIHRDEASSSTEKPAAMEPRTEPLILSLSSPQTSPIKQRNEKDIYRPFQGLMTTIATPSQKG